MNLFLNVKGQVSGVFQLTLKNAQVALLILVIMLLICEIHPNCYQRVERNYAQDIHLHNICYNSTSACTRYVIKYLYK